MTTDLLGSISFSRRGVGCRFVKCNNTWAHSFIDSDNDDHVGGQWGKIRSCLNLDFGNYKTIFLARTDVRIFKFNHEL